MALSRDRVLLAAVALADARGIDAVNMRALAAELGVVPMALYKHVGGKDELLGGMVDAVVEEIATPRPVGGWKKTVRSRILAARSSLLRHPWASRLLESRPGPSAAAMAYTDSLIAMFLDGGFTPDLAHHVMHLLGSRMWGFSQELFPTPPPRDEVEAAARVQELARRYPHVLAIAAAGGGSHEAGTVVGAGCDDQFEFEFALDLLLDGVERLHRAGWSSVAARA